MTEKEKMVKGELYDAGDKELLNERQRAKEQCFKFNQLSPLEEEQGLKLLKELLGSVKGDISILPPFWCDYGYNIEVGEHFFSNHNLIILDGAKVSFGDHVFIGPHCGFYTAGHPLDARERNLGLEYAKPIRVGNDVWIGAGVHVLPGVTIGNNVVIGAGSVVVKDIPDDSLAVGNPCQVIGSTLKK